jgi:6-pyruvoyltetrahydropterin/6-carboxytetrahydropterin synthase
MSIYRINIFKEAIHFNAAHFTIFSETQRERLHGHDYFLKAFITCDLQLNHGLIFDYKILKKLMSNITEQLNEFFLLPEHSPMLKIKYVEDNIEFSYQHDFFSLPKKDVKLLPLQNVSNEELLNWIYQQFKSMWIPLPQSIVAIELELENGRGQSISQIWSSK